MVRYTKALWVEESVWKDMKLEAYSKGVTLQELTNEKLKNRYSK